MPATRGRARSDQRILVTSDLSERQHGVASRVQLRDLGVGADDIRNEVAAGRWHRRGRSTIQLGELGPRATWYQALFEAGPHVRLDGITVLLWHGLKGWDHDLVDLVVPHGRHFNRVAGARVWPQRTLEPTHCEDPPRSHPVPALIRAAQHAVSDRQAATLVAMGVQQRLIGEDQLLHAWRGWTGQGRKALLDAVIRDVCDGAHSLGELDFAALCRAHQLPEPRRQELRKGSNGRVYLDVRWDCGLVVEIDGAQHGWGLAGLADALRQNELVLTGDRVLRIPVLGLRVQPEVFMAQVRRALACAS